MGAALHTDHVNYLVWRYLQEQGYGRAAIQLSRDWNNHDPQSLPFADNVGKHTLVQMLQDALAYDKLLADAHKTQDRHTPVENGESASQRDHPKSRWNFVNVTERRLSDKSPESRRLSSIDASDLKRKRPRRETVDGQRAPVIRRKPSKTAEQTGDTSGDAMDMDGDAAQTDQDMQETVEELPVKEEPPPPPLPHTLEIGNSVGMQSEPIIDKTLAKTVAKTSIPGSEIFRVDWHSPDSLVVSGGSVCHTLHLNPKSSLPTVDGDVEQDEHPLPYNLDAEPAISKLDKSTRYSVGQWERSPSGDQVAAAIEQLHESGDMDGTLSILHQGRQIPLAQTPNVVLALKWDTSSTKLLTIWDSVDGEQSFINIWDAKKAQPCGQVVSSKQVRDAEWLGESSFACCGENVFDVYSVEADTVDHIKSVETDRAWDELKFDSISGMAVCNSVSDGELGLFDSKEHVLHTKNAHEDSITSFHWQPVASRIDQTGDRATRLLASSCTDGSVKLWNAREALECIHTFAAGPMMPAWSLEFAPDGSRVAAAIGDQVRVWEAKADGNLIAKWEDDTLVRSSLEKQNSPGVPRLDDTDPMMRDDEMREDAAEAISPFYSLAWDRAGRRLAISRGAQISVIEMPWTTVEADAPGQAESQAHEMT